MSEQLINELNKYKSDMAQVQARLAAYEQYANNLLREFIENKTNLNLYMAAHAEVNYKLKELTHQNELLLNEINGYKSTQGCLSAS